MLFNKLAKGICATGCICLLQSALAYGQRYSPTMGADTLRLDLKQAQKVFLDSNLQLLAQRYNIQSGVALTEQARKWDNPVLNTDQNLYTKSGFFQHTVDADGNPQGEVFVQVQQLIKTAGKRGRQVDLARTNVDLANWQFRSVMRNLRTTLINDFYTIAELQSMASLYGENMRSLAHLLDASAQQLKAGNIARKEHLRVQSLVVNLQQDMAENARDINNAESELKTLLRITGNVYIMPVAAETESSDLPMVSLPQLVDTAMRNNTDYQQEAVQLQYNQQSYRLQRAMAVPDVTVGTEFDQAANYAPNYFGLAVSLPLPLWDRNKGNIKSAQYLVKQQQAVKDQAAIKLQNDVLNAYQNLVTTAQLGSTDNNTFYTEYYQLQKNILESYGKRQISLVEFLDYFNNYMAIREAELKRVLNLRLAKANLNDITGADLIK